MTNGDEHKEHKNPKVLEIEKKKPDSPRIEEVVHMSEFFKNDEKIQILDVKILNPLDLPEEEEEPLDLTESSEEETEEEYLGEEFNETYDEVQTLEESPKLNESPEEQIIDVENEAAEEPEDDDGITVERILPKCVVHHGAIAGEAYVCGNCGTFYCMRCAKMVIESDNLCWNIDFCGVALDPTKPIKKVEDDGPITTE